MRNLLVLLIFAFVWENCIARQVIPNVVEQSAEGDLMESDIDDGNFLYENEEQNSVPDLGKRQFYEMESNLYETKMELDDMDLENNEVEAINPAKPNFKKIGTKYYHIENEEKLIWIMALDECQQMNASLVSLQNIEEWNALKPHLQRNKNYWLDIWTETSFVSETNRERAYFLMFTPNVFSVRDSNEKCLELESQSNHIMKEVDCFEENYYVCELSLNLNLDRLPTL